MICSTMLMQLKPSLAINATLCRFIDEAYSINWTSFRSSARIDLNKFHFRSLHMEMLDAFVNQRVVLDMSSPFVCMGKLTRVSEHFYELQDADIHDLRDSPTTRENYVVAAKHSGIKPN